MTVLIIVCCVQFVLLIVACLIIQVTLNAGKDALAELFKITRQIKGHLEKDEVGRAFRLCVEVLKAEK